MKTHSPCRTAAEHEDFIIERAAFAYEVCKLAADLFNEIDESRDATLREHPIIKKFYARIHTLIHPN